MQQNDLSIPLIKYELIFDEKIDGPYLKQNVISKYKNDDIIIVEEDEEDLHDDFDADEDNKDHSNKNLN